MYTADLLQISRFFFLGELYGAQPRANPVEDWLIVKENNQLSTKLPKFDINVGAWIVNVEEKCEDGH